jgi:hypothetical protein
MKVLMVKLYIQQAEEEEEEEEEVVVMVVEVKIYIKVAGMECEVMLVLREEGVELYPYKTKEAGEVVEEERT